MAQLPAQNSVKVRIAPAGSVSATSVAGPGGAQTSTTQGGQTTGFQTTGQQTTGGTMGGGAGMPTGASVSAANAASRMFPTCLCPTLPRNALQAPHLLCGLRPAD